MRIQGPLALTAFSLLVACVPVRPQATTEPLAARDPATVSEPVAAPQPAAVAATDPAREEFETLVRPILENRCTPCHFPGGKMYDRLPFDQPGTIRVLGTALFTRIRDEEERQAIRAFLGVPAEALPEPP